MAPASARRSWSACNEARHPPYPLHRLQRRLFPARLICPRCGNATWRDDEVHEGVVEQTTIVHHAAGQKDWKPRHIASIRTGGRPDDRCGARRAVAERDARRAVRSRRLADRAQDDRRLIARQPSEQVTGRTQWQGARLPQSCLRWVCRSGHPRRRRRRTRLSQQADQFDRAVSARRVHRPAGALSRAEAEGRARTSR